jgi:hypothetical protein
LDARLRKQGRYQNDIFYCTARRNIRAGRLVEMLSAAADRILTIKEEKRQCKEEKAKIAT